MIALALACGAGVLALGFAATANAAEPPPPPTETEPAPQPTPDPAPLPSLPKPKPAATSSPASVHHAPVQRFTPRVHSAPRTHAPAYRPAHRQVRARPHARPRRVVRRHATPARHHAKPRVATVTRPKPAPEPAAERRIARMQVAPETEAVTAATAGAPHDGFVIAGLAVAALLFFLVVALPATGARFTAPGRVLIDHQFDLVLAGLAALALSAILLTVRVMAS
jgi:hypothetical protein